LLAPVTRATGYFSVAVAVAGSLLALRLVFVFRDNPPGRGLLKLAGAMLMGRVDVYTL